MFNSKQQAINSLLDAAINFVEVWESDRDFETINCISNNLKQAHEAVQEFDERDKNDTRLTQLTKFIHGIAGHPFLAGVIIQACDNYLTWWEGIPQEQKEADFKKAMIGLGSWQQAIDELKELIRDKN